MFAKIENQAITLAPKEIDGVPNPPAEVYIAHGWYPVTLTQTPTNPDGYYYEPGWVEGDKEIIQTWTLVDPSSYVADSDKAEAYDILMGVSE